jgi:3,4-dihydroxy 2-butanone 4-phosphate synthase / GTP cyclohydrolase II
MQVDNTSHFGTPFTVPVEARYGVSTGISAQDRSHTVRVLIDPRSGPNAVVMPGHMFPLRARAGGVLVRSGHTEATVDLARMAGLYPAAVLCEITKGTDMARMPDIRRFGKRHGLKIITIQDLIGYRLAKEQLVYRVSEMRMPTEYGEFTAYAYGTQIDNNEHLALVLGDIPGETPPLVRVHDECVAGDVFGSERCDCGPLMRGALKRIAREGRGLFLYMRQAGRPLNHHTRLRAYATQGVDGMAGEAVAGLSAERRDYGVGMQILRDLGIRRMQLLTNSPVKRAGLEAYGLEVTKRISVPVRR